MEVQLPDEDVMVRTAVASLSGRYVEVDADRITSVVERQVHDWCHRARIKTYVGIIAERHARDELDHIGVGSRPRKY